MNITKIAFQRMGGDGWPVGPVYLRNLFYALRQACASKLELVILAPNVLHDNKEYADFVEADRIILIDSPRRWSFAWFMNGVAKRFFDCQLLKELKIRNNQIDIVFGSRVYSKYFNIPTLSWIWDFQHIHLPEMFSESDRIARDRLFFRCAKYATRIIVMSEFVKKDFESFAPEFAHKAKVLHPVSYIPESIYEYDLNSILQLYDIPEKFVYLPNKFWKHKNHELVFRSISRLKENGIKIFLVCSGNTKDNRHPGYFDIVTQEIVRLGIQNQVKILGLIPHEHVLLLMRQSICVLNPSLFEGFGVTVDEARSIGKKVLVSDIPPHHEQNPPYTTFFDPYNSDELAEKLNALWNTSHPGPDLKLETEAQQCNKQRIVDNGKRFLSIVEEAQKTYPFFRPLIQKIRIKRGNQ